MKALIELYEYFFNPIRFFKENPYLERVEPKYDSNPDLTSSMHIFNPYYAKFWSDYDKTAMHNMVYPVVWFPKYSKEANGSYMINGPILKYSSLKLIMRHLPPKIYNRVIKKQSSWEAFLKLCRYLEEASSKLPS